ncbi:carboxylate-amine ligase [Cruoricaptor ignavus]|uniref:Putative glutamate--cysteine ligase 2 n=1 Tax=Cruoricaptor ignavus TaxID=1118202 RepID=A0A7M1T4N9_9FLAO|nr:carboxylate-amine ligase [Cruoricaptor ignavus]QOR73913.1 carboxylate-amine ligase [Cruoricaptor ignavus]
MSKFTIGIEEEYQIIDKETRDLVSHVSKILDSGSCVIKENLKNEMHESVIEMETCICNDISHARQELTDLRAKLVHTAHEQGLRVSGGGTHPFSHWREIKITAGERYTKIVNDLGDVARSNLIFGLHVHIGLPNPKDGIKIQNEIRTFLPLIYALSTNSPFWIGRKTGFKSYRHHIFTKFPRTGIPEHFETNEDYLEYIDLLVKAGTIDNAKKIWWDLRVHPFYPTIEFRICDMPLKIEETVCIAAIMQALVAKTCQLHAEGKSLPIIRKMNITENKWRAAKMGAEAEFINFETKEIYPLEKHLEELLRLIDDQLDELGSREAVEYVWEIMKNGTGADRQLKIYEETGDLAKVVDYMIAETEYGITHTNTYDFAE